MRPHRRECVVLLFAAPLPMFAAASEPATHPYTERIRISAQIRQPVRSDGGRFALMAVNVPDVGCDPCADGVFANGFENP